MGAAVTQLRDLIDRLRRAENTTLGVGALWNLCDDAADALDELAAERDALRAELERLRDALQSIADNTCCEGCQEAALVGRAALADRIEKERPE